MSGFSDSIVAGVGNLIRTFIRSPNYVPGVSGWTINKDGSVEFNAGTFRGTIVISNAGVSLLVYNGTPAFGNLMLSISAVDGTDSFGNRYTKGIGQYSGGPPSFDFGRFLAYNTVEVAAGGLTFALGEGGTDSQGNAFNSGLNLYGDNGLNLFADPTNLLAGGGSIGWNTVLALIRLYSDEGFAIQTPMAAGGLFKVTGASVAHGGPDALTIDDNGFKFGSAPAAQAYFEKALLDNQVIANGGGFTQLTNFAAVAGDWNDYGATRFGLAAGTWSCPRTGAFDFTMLGQFLSGAWNSGAAIAVTARILNSTTGKPIAIGEWEQARTSTLGRFTLCASDLVTIGDVITYSVFQNTGVAQTVDNTLSYVTVGQRTK